MQDRSFLKSLCLYRQFEPFKICTILMTQSHANPTKEISSNKPSEDETKKPAPFTIVSKEQLKLHLTKQKKCNTQTFKTTKHC